MDKNDISKDEISLRDLWQVITRYKWWVSGVPAFAMVLAFIISSRMPPIWEAVATLRVGQIPQVAQANQFGQQPVQLIELPADIAAQIEFPNFKVEVLNELNVSLDAKNRYTALRKTLLTAKQIQNTNLVEIKSHGFSPQEARDIIQIVVKRIQENHKKLTSPIITSINRQILNINKEIDRLKKSLKNPPKSIKSSSKSESSEYATEDLVLTYLLSNSTQRLYDLKQQKLQLEESLNLSEIHSTSLVGSIFVKENPVSPRKFFNVALAGVLGLFFGIFMAFLLNNIHSFRNSS